MTTSTPPVPRISATDDPEQIIQTLRESGGLIIEGLLSKDLVRDLNNELNKPLEGTTPGSKHNVDMIQDFHGKNTKRLTNITTHSKIFRHQVLENDLVHTVCERVFHEDSGTYWMGAGQVIQIGPGNKAQALHRDQSQYPIFDLLGPKAPEATVNFLIALTDFTEENGATRVIPGSHLWDDYSNMGSPEQTLPATMKAGDAILMGGKTVHGGGANKTADEQRRGLAFTMQCSYLTPEEANPFIIGMDIVKQLSPRAQRLLGFRSQFPKPSPGLWQSDYSEIADVLGLTGEDPALERLREEIPNNRRWLRNVVVHRAYIYGTSFYPTPKQFLYFFARFVGFIQNSHPAFHDGLAKLLIPRMKERIGLPGDPIPLAMRLIACNQLGITNQYIRLASGFPVSGLVDFGRGHDGTSLVLGQGSGFTNFAAEVGINGGRILEG